MASLKEKYTHPFGRLRDGVPGAEYLYVFLVFPGISVFLGVALYQVSLILLVLSVLALFVVSERLRVSWSLATVTILYALFLLYAAISMLWSPSSEYALYKFSRLAIVCTLLIVAPTLLFDDTDRLFAFFKLAMYATLLVAVVILLGHLSPEYSRAYELFGSDSHIRPGRYIGFGIVVTAFYVVSSTERFQKYTYGLALGVLVLAITVSESRGPLVAAGVSVGLLVLLTLASTRGEKVRAYQFLLAGILGVLSLFVLHVSFAVSIPNFDRIIPLLQGDLDPSTRGRVEYYYQGLLIWLQNPIFGNGIGSFPIYFFGTDTQGYPHNFAIEILAELGLIGLALFGAVLVGTLRPLVAVHREHPVAVLLICLFVYALLNASVSKDLQGNRIVFSVIGLSLSLGLLTGSDS